MTTLGNNGNQLANLMHDNGELFNGISLDQAEAIAIKEYATTEQQQRWLKKDDFWEDFCYRCGELGYVLAV